MKDKIFSVSIILSIVLAIWGLWPPETKIRVLFDGKPAANKELELFMSGERIVLDENGEYVFEDGSRMTILVKGNTVIQSNPGHTVIFDISDKKWVTTTIKYHFKLAGFEIKESTVLTMN